MNDFSDRFKILRTEKGLSQHELSTELDIPRTTISSWELGRRSPDIKMLKSLADYFHVSTDYLLGRSSERNPIHANNISDIIYNIIKDDNTLADFIDKLAASDELQAISKQIKDLPKSKLLTLNRIIKALEVDD